MGVDEHRHVEGDRAREERVEPGLRQLGAGDVGQHEHALHPELLDAARELVGGLCRRLQWHPGERDQALLAVDQGGDPVVDGAGDREAEIRLGPVRALKWRGRDHLEVDAHRVHVRELGLDRGELRPDRRQLASVHVPGQRAREADERFLVRAEHLLDQAVGGLDLGVPVHVDYPLTVPGHESSPLFFEP